MQQAASSTWNLLLLMMIRLGSAPNNARVHCRLTRALSPYRDLQSLHPVVTEAGQVPRRLERLGIARRIGRAARELVFTAHRVPDEAPARPAVRMSFTSDGRDGPMTVHAELDALDRRGARPRAPDDL